MLQKKNYLRGFRPGNTQNRPAQLQRPARVFEILDLASIGIIQ